MEIFDTIIPIEKEFDRFDSNSKFHHTMVADGRNAMIFKVDGDGAIMFEVFRKEYAPKATFVDGKFIQVEGVGRLKYPSAKDFGVRNGWAKTTLKDAEIIFKMLEYGADNKTINGLSWL